MFTPAVLNTEDGGLGAEQPEEVHHPERDSAYKTTTPECEPVDMEDVGPPRTLSVSATGEVGERWPGYMGNYTMTKEQYRDRPVYRNSKGRYLYTLKSGAWGVSGWVGDSLPVYRSIDPAPSPALCQNWEYEYADNDWKYKPGDITVVDISDPGESQEGHFIMTALLFVIDPE